MEIEICELSPNLSLIGLAQFYERGPKRLMLELTLLSLIQDQFMRKWTTTSTNIWLLLQSKPNYIKLKSTRARILLWGVASLSANEKSAREMLDWDHEPHRSTITAIRHSSICTLKLDMIVINFLFVIYYKFRGIEIAILLFDKILLKYLLIRALWYQGMLRIVRQTIL